MGNEASLTMLFSAVSQVMTLVNVFVSVYSLIIFVYVLSSWIPRGQESRQRRRNERRRNELTQYGQRGQPDNALLSCLPGDDAGERLRVRLLADHLRVRPQLLDTAAL